jgi:GNAT superfamily N-acetyltransferase
LAGAELVRDSCHVVVPESIRRAALFPEVDLPALPLEHPTRRRLVAGVFVRLPAGLPVAIVSPERIEESEIDRTVDEVRRFLRTEEREKGIWIVPDEALPGGLAARLKASGMVPNDLPGIDAREARMVALDAPLPGPPGVLVRRAEDFEEFRTAQLIAAESVEMDGRMRRAFEDRAELLWSFESADGQSATFVALLDEQVIAFAKAHFGRTAVYLGGAGTRPDQRGRGAYTALVRARWEAAVERGTPALTVGAGAMSRPVLEHLGFTIVGWADCLLDELS